MEQYFKKENYEVVTNPKKAYKKLFKEYLNCNYDEDLAECYINGISRRFSLEEIKFMKQTLTQSISSVKHSQTTLMTYFTIIIALLTLSVNAVKGDYAIYFSYAIPVVVFLYAVTLAVYFIKRSEWYEKNEKIINYLNLIIEISKKNDASKQVENN